ncbi:YopX protein [Weeksella virosa]|uniref:YopX protein n=2 Tax=Weeksellaceae TaxID=2762318 RepID=F0NYW0_WEEVC|nr:YopX protein [Weeksella virosa DSM 16922]SUP53433.1 YopX protein [Weeksella virosa]VEH63101.1 YopX protein [Weeksella virosa]
MGYAKESISSVVYYKAYNDFQWSEKQMDFDTVDRDIGLKDKKHRRIYEGDIVLYYLSESFVERRGLVQINEETQQAELVDLRQGFITPINVESYNLFEHDKLEVVSHAFTENSELR